jgi:hypothetical protein
VHGAQRISAPATATLGTRAIASMRPEGRGRRTARARLLRAAIGGQFEREIERWERVRCRALPQKDVDQIAALAASMAADGRLHAPGMIRKSHNLAGAVLIAFSTVAYVVTVCAVAMSALLIPFALLRYIFS